MLWYNRIRGHNAHITVVASDGREIYVKIKSLQKLTLLDFPERVGCTVFVSGCNFRCPFCHNGSLVLPERDTGDGYIDEEEFFSFLEKRRGMLTGVCISGGEPTLMPDLGDFAAKIKAMGYAVKLDTNGYRPEVLEKMIDGGLVDYVAMDIKSSRESYGRLTGLSNIDISKIERSAEILMSGRVPFEFRTTVVGDWHTVEDFHSIGRWLRGDEKYFLQDFRDSGDLISSGLYGYDKKDLLYLLNVLKEYIPNAELRG